MSPTAGEEPVVTSTVVPVLVPVVQEESAPPAPVGFDLAADLFGDDRIPEFELELSDAALEDLRAEPRIWVEGALVYAGVRFEPVGIRLKGGFTFRPIDDKPSIKVKLDRYVDGLDLFDLEELTFDNMVSDPTMMHERVSYRLFREHGLPASRANHAALRINGEERGLYTLVENVDEELLALWYADPTGAMWEMDDVDFADTYIDRFEHESGSDDRATLQAIADAIEAGGQEGYDAAAAWVDWDEVVDFVAASVVSGQFDCYPWRSPGDDVHLYFDPADGRLDILPHGTDETFIRDDRDPWVAPGLLFTACLASPTCADDYAASIWDVQATSEAIDLVSYAEDVRDQIESAAEADPRRPYDMDEVEDAQDDMLGFIRDRADHLSPLIGGP